MHAIHLFLIYIVFVQSQSHVQLFATLWPVKLLCPPLFLRVCFNSCPLSQLCYLTISSSATCFSFCLQSFSASGSLLLSRLFALGDQSVGASASELNSIKSSEGLTQCRKHPTCHFYATSWGRSGSSQSFWFTWSTCIMQILRLALLSYETWLPLAANVQARPFLVMRVARRHVSL